MLRQSIAQVRTHLQDIGFELLTQILTALAAMQTQHLMLPTDGAETVVLRSDDSRLEVVRIPANAIPLPWQVTLPIPGRVDLQASCCTLVIQRFSSGAEARRSAARHLMEQKRDSEGFVRRWEPLLLRRKVVTLPLAVRSWRPGDRMRPAGLGGSKKIQDLFTDRKIPARERNKIPILTDLDGNGRILAVLGVHRDEITLATTGEEAEEGEVLLITLLPLEIK